MLAVLQTSPVPFWSRYGQTDGVHFGHVLTGDTHEELAWDMVEQYFDDPMGPSEFGGGSPGGAVMILSADSIEPNLTRAMAYKAQRFSEAWWESQRMRMLGFLGGGYVAELSVAEFRRMFSERTLLAIYLSVMIGRGFAMHHGMPRRPLDAEVALDYLAENHYLHWLDETNPNALLEITTRKQVRA